MWSFTSGSASGLQLGASIVSSATIPNSDIVFRRDGAGDRALVFVHGFLDDQYVWNPVIADLTAPGFEIVRLDLAGFGDRTEATGRSRAGTVPGLPSADGAIGT
jgi:pimeloyl-ACP methyl ester carboxylesterase